MVSPFSEKSQTGVGKSVSVIFEVVEVGSTSVNVFVGTIEAEGVTVDIEVDKIDGDNVSVGYRMFVGL